MDNQPALNPTVAIAVVAARDHAFRAGGQGPTVYLFEPVPHENLAPMVLHASLADDSTTNPEEESAPRVAASSRRRREPAAGR